MKRKLPGLSAIPGLLLAVIPAWLGALAAENSKESSPQAVSPDGSLVDDFLFVESDRVVNVCNAPSPAATASLHIGSSIVDRLTPRFG